MRKEGMMIMVVVVAWLFAVGVCGSGVMASSVDESVERQLNTPTPTPMPTPTPTPFTDCFPATAQVELESGARIQVSDLKLGQRVRVSAGVVIDKIEFSPVTFWGHRDANAVGEYLRVYLDSGKQITLSSTHIAYVFKRTDGTLLPTAVPAREVHIGDVMRDVNGYARVTLIKEGVVAKGKFNPHTMNGDIVVDGVLVSTYNAVLAPRAAHALLMAERLVQQVCGGRISLMEGLLDTHTPGILRFFATHLQLLKPNYL